MSSNDKVRRDEKKQQRDLNRSKYQSLLPLLSPLQALDSCLLGQPCCKQVGWPQHCRTDPRHWGTEAHHSDSDMAHCPKWKTRAMGPCPKTSKTNLHQNKLLALCHTKIWIGWIDADMHVQNHADALSRSVSTVSMHTSDFKISLTWWQKPKVAHFLSASHCTTILQRNRWWNSLASFEYISQYHPRYPSEIPTLQPSTLPGIVPCPDIP